MDNKLTNVVTDKARAEAFAAKLGETVTGTYLDLQIRACPVGGSFDIIVEGSGTDQENVEMAIYFMATALGRAS